ncbi:hypothetical protein UC8_25450 [Roseimaritima ulvae]|uniref:Bacterial Ig-like domain (Group 2) n=2 Tax=Roseimaritima ulvae TaxID=980254 RepID=A0A5B9R2N5_9BACT|nr:hypothetical protein UC8_25450 [Roseimaritima ulvae]
MGTLVVVGLLMLSNQGHAEPPAATPDGESRWSFRNDVQSILSRHGCNSGACHGTLAGKGGFRLSLHGFDSQADFQAITKQNRGRRIEIADPGRSLLLAKPTGALPHKGGIRLDTDSRDYRILAEWIAAGAAGPAAADARLVRIEVTPEQARLAPGDTAQLAVQAIYSDDRVVDVTSWAKFSATDEAIAGVDENGLVTIRGSGEGAIRVWFGSRIALARLTVPFAHPTPQNELADVQRNNFIDDLVLDQLQTLNLTPSPRCDDETFLRRAFLDTVGRLPNEQQRQAYLDAPESLRRSQLIERLLASDDYVDYWTYKWSDMLLVNGNRLRPQAVQAYYQWVRQAVAEDRPWDEVVRQILTATGVSTENGATNFYALHQTPEEMTENACQAFLGLSIGCAKCHNHPLEKWSNDQYYGMANLFARVRAKGWGGETRNGDGIRTLYVADSGDVIQPTRGKPQPPTPLDAQPLDFDDPQDRRIALADWMTKAENPYFSRAITNRVWANFFGRGLVEPVDDLRISNPASNEPLLRASAEYLAESAFDLKSLMRVILESETYQRSSVPLPTNKEDDRYLSRYYPRRLMAEVLLDAVDQVLQTSTKFDEVAFSGADVQKTDFYPTGTRAIQLYDSAVSSYFLKTFGRNPREIVCECERSAEPSLVQVLHLSNGDTLNPKLNADNNLLARLQQQDADTDQVITALFERALARRPTEQERENLRAIVREYEDNTTDAWRDLAWSLLTSTEFTFNH